jgi:hypothetical protein
MSRHVATRRGEVKRRSAAALAQAGQGDLHVPQPGVQRDPVSRSMKALLAALLILAPAAGRAAETPIDPGYWETTNSVVSPIRSSKTERRCIGAAQVAKFMEGPGNHIYRCTYPTKMFRGGRIVLKGSCKSRDKPPFPIEGQGTYTRDSFHLEALAHPTLGPITLPVRAQTDARRIGDACPAPEPAPAPASAAAAAPAGGNDTAATQ